MAVSTESGELRLYHPLPAGKYIRILSMKPWKLGQGRRYCLSARSIEDSRPFLALSYRWKAEEAHEPIIVNDQPALIMRTVKDFLDLRFKKQRIKDIFIDCICINQQDLDERASQVQLMGELYSTAAKVCIWLGTLVSRWEELQLFAILGVGALFRGAYESHRQLASRVFPEPYWFRSWVIQEVCMAQNIEIFWVRLTIPEHHLQNIAIGGSADDRKAFARSTMAVLQRKRDTGLSLARLLESFAYTEATEMRDKVYALLGMAEDVTEHHVFPVDYS